MKPYFHSGVEVGFCAQSLTLETLWRRIASGEKPINMTTFRDCPGNGWAQHYLCVASSWEKGKNPRKSQENDRRVRRQSREKVVSYVLS